MIKSISFIVLTHLFQFNQLKILRQRGYLLLKLFCQQYFYMFIYLFDYIQFLQDHGNPVSKFPVGPLEGSSPPV